LGSGLGLGLGSGLELGSGFGFGFGFGLGVWVGVGVGVGLGVGVQRTSSRAEGYLPYISPISRLYLAYSRLYLPISHELARGGRVVDGGGGGEAQVDERLEPREI